MYTLLLVSWRSHGQRLLWCGIMETYVL